MAVLRQRLNADEPHERADTKRRLLASGTGGRVPRGVDRFPGASVVRARGRRLTVQHAIRHLWEEFHVEIRKVFYFPLIGAKAAEKFASRIKNR